MLEGKKTSLVEGSSLQWNGKVLDLGTCLLSYGICDACSLLYIERETIPNNSPLSSLSSSSSSSSFPDPASVKISGVKSVESGLQSNEGMQRKPMSVIGGMPSTKKIDEEENQELLLALQNRRNKSQPNQNAPSSVPRGPPSKQTPLNKGPISPPPVSQISSKSFMVGPAAARRGPPTVPVHRGHVLPKPGADHFASLRGPNSTSGGRRHSDATLEVSESLDLSSSIAANRHIEISSLQISSSSSSYVTEMETNSQCQSSSSSSSSSSSAAAAAALPLPLPLPSKQQQQQQQQPIPLPSSVLAISQPSPQSITQPSLIQQPTLSSLPPLSSSQVPPGVARSQSDQRNVLPNSGPLERTESMMPDSDTSLSKLLDGSISPVDSDVTVPRQIVKVGSALRENTDEVQDLVQAHREWMVALEQFEQRCGLETLLQSSNISLETLRLTRALGIALSLEDGNKSVRQYLRSNGNLRLVNIFCHFAAALSSSTENAIA